MGCIRHENGDQTCIFWYPEGVSKFVGLGGDYLIGKVNDSTVLKYPKGEESDGDDLREEYEYALTMLQVERQIYERVGKHPRIIEFKGWQEHGPGLVLEYAPNGSLDNFLRENPEGLSMKQRLRVARETAEGVHFVHSRNVLLRDIATRNILLDSDLHVKLCDLTGQLFGENGEILAEGHGWEDFDATKPRADKQLANIETDLFALGTTIFNIVTGKEPFPDMQDDKEMRARFEKRSYPELDVCLGGKVVWACWDSSYKSAGEIAEDLTKLEQDCPQ